MKEEGETKTTVANDHALHSLGLHSCNRSALKNKAEWWENEQVMSNKNATRWWLDQCTKVVCNKCSWTKHRQDRKCTYNDISCYRLMRSQQTDHHARVYFCQADLSVWKTQFRENKHSKMRVEWMCHRTQDKTLEGERPESNIGRDTKRIGQECCKQRMMHTRGRLWQSQQSRETFTKNLIYQKWKARMNWYLPSHPNHFQLLESLCPCQYFSTPAIVWMGKCICYHRWYKDISWTSLCVCWKHF